MAGFELSQVSFSYGQGPVLRQVGLTIAAGDMVALLGPNGSGKTTLLKVMCGVLAPEAGEVRLDGSPLGQLKRRDIARRVAVVPQHFHMPFAFSSREVVLLGRTPFLKAFSNEDEADCQAIERAMELIGIDGMQGRFFNELSGGERQKVVLAMALAQEPRVLLLDEPTAHLDINHQVEILEAVKLLNRDHGITVIAAMHDLNLAALYFHRLLLLKEGAIVADGPPHQVLTAHTIAEVFATSVGVTRHPQTGTPHIVVNPRGDSV